MFVMWNVTAVVAGVLEYVSLDCDRVADSASA